MVICVAVPLVMAISSLVLSAVVYGCALEIDSGFDPVTVRPSRHRLQ
jgi:hypothetical protein